jgi:hypothetical protein
MNLSETEQSFLVKWLVANVVGWAVGLGLAAALWFLAMLLRVFVPVWLLAPLFPVAGGVVGLAIGYTQWAALFDPTEDRLWMRASAWGGALGAVPAAGFWWLFSFDPLVAQLAVGASIAAGIGLAQVMFGVSPNWRAAYRWAVVNAIAGIFCAGVSPSGDGLWLGLTCGLGTGLFGIITGAALLKTMREP